jgi:hypothetical protein
LSLAVAPKSNGQVKGQVPEGEGPKAEFIFGERRSLFASKRGILNVCVSVMEFVGLLSGR